MKTIALRNLGRFGNRCFRYCFARALCEQKRYELRTEPWEGEAIFTLDGYEPKRPDGTEDIVIEGYCQNQESLIYSRADCRRWFKFLPRIDNALAKVYSPDDDYIVAHLRRGDYHSAGYPTVSPSAVEHAAKLSGLKDAHMIEFVSEDNSLVDLWFSPDLLFLPDFYRLMCAPVLFRANSSFSWWAATLGHGRVFSPVITGLAGGVEHDNVPFVEGNWPRLAELPNITDLHLSE